MWNDPWLLVSCHRNNFCVVKGHFCSFLVSNIYGYLRNSADWRFSPIQYPFQIPYYFIFISLQRDALISWNCLWSNERLFGSFPILCFSWPFVFRFETFAYRIWLLPGYFAEEKLFFAETIAAATVHCWKRFPLRFLILAFHLLLGVLFDSLSWDIRFYAVIAQRQWS